MDKDYISELNVMYKSVYTVNNRCPCFFDECKPKNETIKFCSDRVRVGEKYGEKYPKVLFVGLEGTHEGPDYTVLDITAPSKSATNNHYRGVRYTLSYILSAFDNITPPKDATVTELKQEKYTKHLSYFCLTNIYKCAFSPKKSGLPHTQKMKEYCSNILINEVEILKPDILVIQASSSVPPSLWKKIYKNFNNGIEPNRLDKGNDYTSAYELFHKDGSPFYVIWTYHGNGPTTVNGHRAIFVNNKDYISDELNPVLDSVIEKMKSRKE